MPPRQRAAVSYLPAIAACFAVGVAGCSMDDVQFNGGVFDAVGLSDSSKSSRAETKMTERAPLIVPPALDRLPPPGETPPPTQIADIRDPDAVKAATHAEQEAKQAEYCKKHYDIPKSQGDASVESVEGPYGPCRKSVLTAIKKWNESDEAEGQ